MASAFTTNVSIEKPANGDYPDTWNVPVNADWDIIDLVFGGAVSINVVAASGIIALTAAQYRPRYILFSGLLTANVNYRLPSGVGGAWVLLNGTTGAFTVTFSSAGGGASALVPRTSLLNVRSDGTNIFVYAAAPGVNSDITSLIALGLTGLVKGTGAGNPLIAAVAGTDYAAPGVMTTFTAVQGFVGTTTNFAMGTVNIAEVETISATAATGTIPYYISSQSVLWYTLNASANWTINLTMASTPVQLNAVLQVGQTVTVTHKVKQGATPFFNNVVQVDGTTSGVTTVWQGGAPIAGNASGIDVYTYSISKTAPATFTVFASQAPFR